MPCFITYVGQLTGHRGWVTSLQCPPTHGSDGEDLLAAASGTGGSGSASRCSSRRVPPGEAPIRLISGSRDKSVIVWAARDKLRRLEGHGGFVQSISLSHLRPASGNPAASPGPSAAAGAGNASTSAPSTALLASASWDKSVRVWDVRRGGCVAKLIGHTHDVLATGMSPDGRWLVSGSRDNSVRLWGLGPDGEHLSSALLTDGDGGPHNDWVSSVVVCEVPGAAIAACKRRNKAVRISVDPDGSFTAALTGSWDGTVKLWSLEARRCLFTLEGHEGHVVCVAASPDGSLCASGGKDGVVLLWDLSSGRRLASLTMDDAEPVNALSFSPADFLLCVATGSAVRLLDLRSRGVAGVLVPEVQMKAVVPQCLSVAWSPEGRLLYTGYSDNTIRIWGVAQMDPKE